MAATITPTRSRTPKPKQTLSRPLEETLPAALSARERLLAALAVRPLLSKETGEQMLLDIQEAREASIAGPFN